MTYKKLNITILLTKIFKLNMSYHSYKIGKNSTQRG